MAKNSRTAVFVIFDLVWFNASYLLAFMLSHAGETASPAEAARNYFAAFPTGFMILIFIKLLAMYIFSVYRIMFEYAGRRDFQRVALSLVACTLASVTAAVLIDIEPALKTSVILFSFIFDMVLVLLWRAVYVSQTGGRKEDADTDEQSLRRRYTPKSRGTGRVMVIGKERAAADLIAEMQANESSERKPEIIIDDDRSRKGDMLLGVEIVGGRRAISLRARRHSIDEIIIAKPTASKRQLAALLRECVKTPHCRISMLPRALTTEEGQKPGAATLADLRRPTIMDLLGRDRPRVDHHEIGDQLRGRVVLVTGGAGAFGTELCRRIIRYRPRRLIALDIDEDRLMMLAAELEAYSTPENEFITVMASVRDQAIMKKVFAAFRPHIVYHAAEIKQIPLAETYQRETFLTNVLGHKLVCDLASEYAAEKFILCSTTRAASPQNVAAECKRIAELYNAEKNEKSKTAYATVRFPNLIEGRGNVIALFEKQIAQGGPVTVTEKDVARRFISAEEAALLTVLATAFAKGGEIFRLGPGEAIKINDLAEAMIRLAGKIPGEEIDILFTQPRPGEYFYEDIDESEGTRDKATPSDRIWLVEESDELKLPHWTTLWRLSPDQMDDAAVKELLRLIFPTYKKKNAGVITRGEIIDNE